MRERLTWWVDGHREALDERVARRHCWMLRQVRTLLILRQPRQQSVEVGAQHHLAQT